MFETETDAESLDTFVERFKLVIDKVLNESECVSGRALSSTYFQLLNKVMVERENSVNASMGLKVLKQYLPKKLDTKNISFGIFLHSFILQFAVIILQLETMSQNCLNWLDNKELTSLQIRTFNDFLNEFPCVSSDMAIIENISLNDDLKNIWRLYRPEKEFVRHYLDLFHRGLHLRDGSAKLRLFEIQTAFSQAMDPKISRGEFVNNFARAWFTYQLKLRIWLTEFVEKSEDKSFFSSFEKHKREHTFEGGITLRQAITKFKKTPIEEKE